jgi:release factor glutamine methyltransferase
MDIASLLNKAIASLANQGFATASIDAEVLLCSVLKKERTFFYSHPGEQLTEREREEYQQLIERRRHGEPVAGIVGV